MNAHASTAADASALLKSRLICVAIIDQAADALPLAEALLAGGSNIIEVTFRTAAAAEAIALIRQKLPQMFVGAGTVLTVDQARQAADAGAQFGVSPGLNETVLAEARALKLPFFPGVMTPTEVDRALNLGCRHLKFFPAEAAGGVNMLKALAGPFAHTGVQFIPTGGITAALLPDYLALPHVAAVGGSWMAERKLVADRAWPKISALTAEAMESIVSLPPK
jgi:2-dehydro-3-deoxyphosphogluconate aldolase/(4S)-4-hydroxy-2-oxoglutarate aldolase